MGDEKCSKISNVKVTLGSVSDQVAPEVAVGQRYGHYRANSGHGDHSACALVMDSRRRGYIHFRATRVLSYLSTFPKVAQSVRNSLCRICHLIMTDYRVDHYCLSPISRT